jgi:hypothetical protein
VLHALHAAQPSTSQWTGQCWSLQASVLARAGQALPPRRAAVSTARSNFRVPAPHDAEQAATGTHPAAETTQSTGHASAAQGRSSSRAPAHGAPPSSALDTTDRVRAWAPVPHVLVHADHADHAERAQSTGQAWVLHAFDSASRGHGRPWDCGATATARARAVVAPPQDRGHGDHAPHAPTSQWTGHALLAPAAAPAGHGLTCFTAGQALPPCCASRVTARARAMVPGPQVVEHGDQDPNPETWQSTGHADVPHARDSRRWGQLLPP